MIEKPPPRHAHVSRRYWESARSERFSLQRCDACGVWQHYPREVCAHCWSTELTWEEPSGTGTVWTYTVVHRAPHSAFAGDVPYAIAIVELDEGPRLLTNLVDCELDALTVGQRVGVTFEHRAEYSVPQFTPIEEREERDHDGASR